MQYLAAFASLSALLLVTPHASADEPVPAAPPTAAAAPAPPMVHVKIETSGPDVTLDRLVPTDSAPSAEPTYVEQRLCYAPCANELPKGLVQFALTKSRNHGENPKVLQREIYIPSDGTIRGDVVSNEGTRSAGITLLTFAAISLPVTLIGGLVGAVAHSWDQVNDDACGPAYNGHPCRAGSSNVVAWFVGGLVAGGVGAAVGAGLLSSNDTATITFIPGAPASPQAGAARLSPLGGAVQLRF